MRSTVLLVAVLSVGCQLEKLNKKAVGNAVARLAVRDAAVLTAVLAEESTCGFKSSEVLQGVKLEGATGQAGRATWTVSDCTIDFGPEWKLISTDCSGVEIKVRGAVTLSATRTVEGILTGSAANPIVPLKPDATVVTHTATLRGYAAGRSDSDASLKLNGGTLSWSAHPKLAVSKTKGVCAVPTSELGLTAVKLDGAAGFVESASRAFNVEIDSSDLSAQLGRWGDKKNALEGTVTVWGGTVTFPEDSDSDGLDPSYDAQKFVDAYACKPDLLTPVSWVCPSFSEKLAQGAAQLTVSTFGTIGSAVDDDTRCGFAAAATVATARLEGSVGSIGSVTFTLPQPCELKYAQKTAVRTDCHGVARELTGTVTVTGTKTVRGWLTGDPAAPVIPNSRDAGKLNIVATLEGLKASDSASTTALTVASGRLGGELGSRLGIDTATGACSIKLPVVYFRGLSWASGQATLHSDGAEYPIELSQSKLDAQAGAREDHTNWLEGELTLNGTKRTIPVAGGPPVLDPAFDAAAHVASYTCMPNLKPAMTEAECTFEDVLAKNVSRLLVQMAGAVASMVNKNDSCGFDSTLNKLAPVEVIGDSGEIGSMKWAVNGCELEPSGDMVIDTGCTGGRRLVSGRAEVTGTRNVVGERETRLLVVASIIPRTRDAVTLDLTEVALSDFAAWSVAPGQTSPAGKLTVRSGTLLTNMNPIIGELASDPGRFEIPTPVAKFNTVMLRGARASLESGVKRFTLDLPDVTLTAQAGTFKGRSNVVSGTVKLGTSTIAVPEMPLDPTFMQAAFDSSYACTPDLRAVVPPN
ncbi:MAG: hypothetical protein JNK82_01995 [Myxococcaceae bacterium]|nr:hypothetical protein [Myxococcaceae bacterium]